VRNETFRPENKTLPLLEKICSTPEQTCSTPKQTCATVNQACSTAKQICSKGKTATADAGFWLETLSPIWIVPEWNFVFPFMACRKGKAHSIASAIGFPAFSTFCAAGMMGLSGDENGN
jgi:hypothetical protein